MCSGLNAGPARAVPRIGLQMPARPASMPSQVLYELLAAGRSSDASAVIDDLARGRRLSDVIATLLEPVLYQIGADVALDVLGPDVEVAAFELVRSAVERLAGRGLGKAPTGRRVVAALAPGEAHDLGLQMVSSLLGLEGWTVEPAARGESSEALVARVVASAPDLVCLSLTTPVGLAETAQVIRAIHAEAPDARVMVGGLAFRLVPERAVRVGADLFAEEARAALATVRGTFGD